ncbi:nuclease domain-containing protein [Arthrobacter cupressi]
MSEYEDFDCPALASAALAVARIVRTTEGLSTEEVSWIVAPFLRVAAKAGGSSQPTPISSWPASLIHVWESLQLVLSAFDATRNGVQASAPLSEIWRLYEGWVGICTKRTIGEELAGVVASERLQMVGADWGHAWTLSDGTVIGMLAQAIVTSTQAFTSMFPEGISSSSSDLRPDVLLFATNPQGPTRVAVLDAKYRAFETLTREAAATGGSKYMWGLEVGQAASADGHGHRILSVTLVSNETSPRMHRASSRIGSARLPFYQDVPDSFRRTVRNLLVSLTT